MGLINLSSNNKVKIIFIKSFIWAFPFLYQERGGLFASIFSKKKRIYAAIPNVAFTLKENLSDFIRLSQKTIELSTDVTSAFVAMVFY